MRILVDAHIPWLLEPLRALVPEADIAVLLPEQITRRACMHADALFVRTRTRCDAALLEGTPVRFVATATIGLDHIDTAWCADRGITAVNAPGCNAPAVAQWVICAAHRLAGRSLAGMTLGIVGMGNVGSMVRRRAADIGMHILVNDPPRQAAGHPDSYTPLHELAARADIITFHTTLNPTSRHLCDAALLAAMRPGTLVLNAARGPVVDTPALVDALTRGHVRAAIDTWEGEPDISLALMERADIATPHIAGYSLQGKQRAAAMTLRSFAAWLGRPATVTLPPVSEHLTEERLVASYDIMADDAAYRAAPHDMERLRDTYPLRNEP